MMKFRMDGIKFYYAFIHGHMEVLKRKQYLNKINVFPVPDGDTGSNLVFTMQSILENTSLDPSISVVSRNMADAALSGSRGNSGIIFGQFIQGLSHAIGEKHVISPREFILAVHHGVEHAYRALSKPVEGTILSVMRSWSETLRACDKRRMDFLETVNRSYDAAKSALQETPQKLKVLRKAGVVDAGAAGFVHFIEGVTHFIRNGKIPDLREIKRPVFEEQTSHIKSIDQEITNRYCTEILLEGNKIDRTSIFKHMSDAGDSLIIAHTDSKLKCHIHTNDPAKIASHLRDFGKIINTKVDDMRRQYEDRFHRKSAIAIVTDSACDLPQEIMDRYQIHMIPVNIQIGEHQYLDKLTLLPGQFYSLLDGSSFPSTSQPPLRTIEMLYQHLLQYYNAIISVHLSGALSGTWNAACKAALNVDADRIVVINSNTLSTSLGLLVMEIAENISEGKSFEEIRTFSEKIAGQGRILVSVKTLRYMVKGGRVSPLRGWIANALNLRPIVSIDDEGRSILYGKAFSTSANIRKIIKIIEKKHLSNPIKRYAIGHAHDEPGARDFEKKIYNAIGMHSEFIMDISPVIGAHAGIGALSVSYI